MPYVGDRIKQYEIEKLLGKGGMGEVYLAQDTQLDRKVAIKFLPKQLKTDEKTQARFIREAKAAAALDHPFICKVYESGEVDGNAYIAMEFIEGETLREKMEAEHFSAADALNIALEVAEALEKAHGKGIIHRDLKPMNIMITPQGHVKVMDFGLAKKVLGESDDLSKTITQASITEQGTIAGTLAYMSPEQARGKKLDGRSDIFSLGIIIHEMLGHKHPFSKTTPIETLSAILRDPPPQPNVRPKTVNPYLRPILKKSLAKDPEDRYQNTSELVADLRKAQKQIHGGVRLPISGIPLYVAVAAIVVLLSTGVYFLSKKRAPGPQQVEIAPISVLLADFENNTGESIFDGALEQAFGISLEGASYITMYNRLEAKKLVNQLYPGATDRLNIERAQLLCGREGIQIAVTGSIEQEGNQYTIKTWAIDAGKDERIAERSRTAKRDDVLKTAQVLATQIRSDIGGIPPESAEILEQETATAENLKAWKAYTNAQELDAQGRYDEAIAEYFRAIEEDPNFGRAYSGLATVYINQGDFEKAAEFHSKALEHIDSMSDREKYRTRIVWYFLQSDYKQVIHEATALVEQFPADSAGYGNLSNAYFYLRNMPKAMEFGIKQAELRPTHVNAQFNLSWFAMGAGNFELAKEQANKTLELDPEMVEAYVCLALAALAQNQPEAAIAHYTKLQTLGFWGESLGTIGLADVALYQGRLNDTLELLAKGIDRDLENKRTDLAACKACMLSHAYLLQGQTDQSVRLADQARAVAQQVETLVPVSFTYIETGNIDKAQAIADELGDKLENRPRAYSKLIEGEIHRKNGKSLEAIEAFNASLKLLDTWLVHFSLGKAYLEANAHAKAHSEMEICLKRQGEATSVFFNDIPSYHFFPPVYYYLGRALEAMGSSGAADNYRTFLTIKEKADGDWMVTDARTRLDNL